MNYYSNSSSLILTSTRGPLETKILYPNGTEETPGTIGLNQSIELNNPFPGHRVYSIVEIKYNNKWSDQSFIFNSASGGIGIKANQVLGDDIDSIVIQSEKNVISGKSCNSGNGFQTSADILTATQFRVVIFCLD